MQEGQEVTWNLGSFGFREAIRRGDKSAIEALRNHVSMMFVGVNEFDASGQDGDFSCDDSYFEEYEEQVVDFIIACMNDEAAADRQAKAEEQEEAAAANN